MSKKIVFKYKFKDDYNPVYINGAYGGVSNKGEIVINFYLERLCLPNSETLVFDDKAEITNCDIKPSDLRESFLRYVENGVLMNLDTAKEVAKWLDTKIKQAEDMLEVKKKDQDEDQ